MSRKRYSYEDRMLLLHEIELHLSGDGARPAARWAAAMRPPCMGQDMGSMGGCACWAESAPAGEPAAEKISCPILLSKS